MSKALFKVMSKSTGYVYNVYKVNNKFNLYKIYNYFEHEYQWFHVDDFIGIDSNLETINKYVIYDIEAIKEIIAIKSIIVELTEENEKLKEENTTLIKNQINSNSEHFRIVKENKRKIDNLRKENKRLKENKLTPEELVNMLNQELVRQNKCYKSRCKKAIELINKRKEEEDNGIGWVEMRTEEYFEECDEVINILNGSDNNE